MMKSVLTSYQRHMRCKFLLRNPFSSSADGAQGLAAALTSSTGKLCALPDVDGRTRHVHYYDSGIVAGPGADLPPIVILGGTAQTIDSYAPHIRPITKHRRLLIVEMRCQGRTELLPEYGTIQQHVQDFKSIAAALNITKCDLVGFSFGGRVSLAVAAHTSLVRRLSVTGVPLRRPTLGSTILRSWKEGLKHGEMRSCAWSFIINGYSDKFLEKFAPKLSLFVEIVVKANDPKKLYHLLEHSHIVEDAHPYSIPSCCERVACPTQVIAALSDRIAGHREVLELAASLKDGRSAEMQGGHLVLFEDPVRWRSLVMEFLNH